MKNLVKVLVVLAVALFATSAFAAEVKFSGEAALDLGYLSKDTGESSSYMGMDQDTGATLNATVKEGNLTAKVGLEADAGGEIAPANGLFEYNLGMAAIVYDAMAADEKWDDDMQYFDDSAAQTLTVKIAGMAFISLFDAYGEGYLNTDYKWAPAINAGVDSTFGPAAVKAGIGLDSYPDKVPTEEEVEVDTDGDGEADAVEVVAGEEDVDSYTAFLVFVNTDISLGAIGAHVAFNMANGYSDVWSKKECADYVAVAKDYSAMGFRVGGSYAMGNMEFGDNFVYSTMNNGGEGEAEVNYTYMRVLDAYFKYNLSDNFYVKPYTYYDITSTDLDGSDEMTDLAVAVRLGYEF